MLSAVSLGRVLTSRTIEGGANERITTPLSVEQAGETRDALAKALYVRYPGHRHYT